MAGSILFYEVIILLHSPSYFFMQMGIDSTLLALLKPRSFKIMLAAFLKPRSFFLFFRVKPRSFLLKYATSIS